MESRIVPISADLEYRRTDNCRRREALLYFLKQTCMEALCREYGIVNFCKQYVNKHIGQESIQAELKALLTEHAMRQVLNDDARDILKRAAKALFNTKFGFDVQFLQG